MAIALQLAKHVASQPGPILGAPRQPLKAAVGSDPNTLLLTGFEAVLQRRHDLGLTFLFEKDVFARIRLADKNSSCCAITFNGAAFGVNALYRRDVAQLAISAMRGSLKPEPRNVSRCGACGAGRNLARHSAPIRQLPGGTRKVPSNRLAIKDQGRNGFAKLPDEFSILVNLAFIDLCALRKHFQNLSLVGRPYGI